MDASQLAHTAFAGYDAENKAIVLWVNTLDGQQHTFTLTDTKTLRESLARAEKALERGEMESALLIKSEPVGVRVDGWDV